MDRVGQCFIITECGFNESIIKEVKNILWQHNYSDVIAEEIPSFNVDLWDFKILKPMEASDFVIVIFTPKERDANFNVSFEFGYARGMNKNVILLLNGKAKDLPSDIQGKYYTSLENPNWKEELTKLIENRIAQNYGPVELPQDIVNLMLKGINDKSFEDFAKLLNKFSSGFRVLENQEIYNTILKIFNTKKYTLTSGEPVSSLLNAISVIFRFDKTEKSLALKNELVPYLYDILIQSEFDLTIQETLRVLIQIDGEESINALVSFIRDKGDDKLRSSIASMGWGFVHSSSLSYCLSLLGELMVTKSRFKQFNMSNNKIQIIDGMINKLSEDIRLMYEKTRLQSKV